jgi:hypothetical protein
MTRTILLSAIAFVAVSCKSDDGPKAKKKSASESSEAVDKKEPKPANLAPEPEPEPEAAKAEPEPEPELPTDPKELELARKTAILEGRYDDALKICAAEDQEKIGEQGVLACVLSACRQNDGDKAREWSKHLQGALKKQARDVCKTSNIPI